MSVRQALREIGQTDSPLIGPFTQSDRGGPAAIAAALERLAEPYEPEWPALRRVADAPEPKWSLVSIYREANRDVVHGLLDQLGRGRAALWALDAVAPSLEGRTVGSGPGHRFSLLNAMLEDLDLDDDEWLVVADDDVRFVRGDVATTLKVADAASLDLAQPSHARWSFLSWGASRHRWGSMVRLTRYVEQGPLLCLGPCARKALVPFPETLGMGWGVEALWAAEDDLELGIVDATTMWHLRPVGAGYDQQAAWRHAEEALAAQGFRSWPDLQRTTRTWRAWEASCPWRA